jgi:hypothetical protein
MGRHPIGGQFFPIIEALRSHTDKPHSVGFLWTSDQPDTVISTWQHTTFTRDISMLPAGFEPAIPASERRQTHTLYRAATRIGNRFDLLSINIWETFWDLLYCLISKCSAVNLEKPLISVKIVSLRMSLTDFSQNTISFALREMKCCLESTLFE